MICDDQNVNGIRPGHPGMRDSPQVEQLAGKTVYQNKARQNEKSGTIFSRCWKNFRMSSHAFVTVSRYWNIDPM
jgi:hypothetical protein